MNSDAIRNVLIAAANVEREKSAYVGRSMGKTQHQAKRMPCPLLVQLDYRRGNCVKVWTKEQLASLVQSMNNEDIAFFV